MAEYYFKEFEDYLKLLCMQHKEVLHDDQQNRCFIRFQSEQDLQSIPNNAGSKLVTIDQFSGRAIGEFDDGKLQQTVTIAFLMKIGDGDPYQKVQEALAKTMQLLHDFYARMKRDYELDSCGPLRFLQPESMSFSPIDGPILENHYGWEMNIPFNVFAPAFDAEKWNE